MRLALPALLLAASQATAGGDLRWGIPVEGSRGPNELHLAACEEGDCAFRLTFRNTQLRGAALTRRFTVEIRGLSVAVTVTEGELRAADEIAVTLPPGFTAEPARLAVEEDATGVVVIRLLPMS
jgi:hypothetical protein